jgi:periplasmic copper chaperone A
MRRVDGLDIAKGAAKVLKPGGDHVMLMDVKDPLKEGDLVKLTLTFEKAGDIEVEATVEAPGATGPHGMEKQPAADAKPTGDNQHHEGH